MGATDVVKSALERNWGMVDRALDGLDDATLARQVTDQCNSISWLMYHMNRVVDIFINTRLRSRDQIWLQDGWNQKYGMSDDSGEGSGSGWTADQVAAWAPPSRDVLLGYYEANKAAAREYLSSLTDADLDATVSAPPGSEPRQVHDLLGVLVFDNVVHGGQIAFLRGYHEGMGWFV